MGRTDDRIPAAAETPGEMLDALKALALNCTLKTDANEESSTDAMIAVLESFGVRAVTLSETVRVAVIYIRPSVLSEEGNRAEWQTFRKEITHDVMILEPQHPYDAPANDALSGRSL